MTKQKILIVEDDGLLRSLLKETINRSWETCDVLEAENGLAALEILEKEKIDLVLSDIKMPIMDGVQLLSELYNRKIWLPIIILTAHGGREIENKLDEFGIVDYLMKPINFHTFREKMTEMLKRQSRRDQVSGMSLATILQILEMEQKTGVVDIRSPEREGRIFFRKGVIVDIDSSGLPPEEALGDLMDYSIGDREITIQYVNHRRRNVINKSLTEILLDAARLLDESHHQTRDAVHSPEKPPTPGGGILPFHTIKEIFDSLKRVFGEGFLEAMAGNAMTGEIIAEIGAETGSGEVYMSLWRGMRDVLSDRIFPGKEDISSFTLANGQAVIILTQGEVVLGVRLELREVTPVQLLEVLPAKIRAILQDLRK